MKKTPPILWNPRITSLRRRWFRNFLLTATCIMMMGYSQIRPASVSGYPSTTWTPLPQSFSKPVAASYAPSYTKLDNEGDPLQDSATTWAMVRDNTTDLIWEAKHHMDGVSHYNDPEDADNTYTWYDSNPNTNGGAAGAPGTSHTNTEAFIRAINHERLGGYSDWRLPTIQELVGLIKATARNPSVNTVYFSDTVPAWYWSASTSVLYPHQAWGVGFRYGRDSYNFKYLYGYVRAVRGGQSLADASSSASNAVSPPKPDQTDAP